MYYKYSQTFVKSRELFKTRVIFIFHIFIFHYTYTLTFSKLSKVIWFENDNIFCVFFKDFLFMYFSFVTVNNSSFNWERIKSYFVFSKQKLCFSDRNINKYICQHSTTFLVITYNITLTKLGFHRWFMGIFCHLRLKNVYGYI